MGINDSKYPYEWWISHRPYMQNYERICKNTKCGIHFKTILSDREYCTNCSERPEFSESKLRKCINYKNCRTEFPPTKQTELFCSAFCEKDWNETVAHNIRKEYTFRKQQANERAQREAYRTFNQQQHYQSFFEDIFREYSKYQRPVESAERISNGTISISIELFNKVLGLCHPDKHGNSERSNQVTTELLKLRKGIK